MSSHDEIISRQISAEAMTVHLNRANSLSWAVNWFLLVAKIYIAVKSNSKAVWASLADSFVDLLSQAVLSLATRYMKIHSPDYPVGRSRLEALSVLASAGIMTMASVEVIQFSCMDLYYGYNGELPNLNVDSMMYCVLTIGIVLKLFLWLYCNYINKIVESDSLEALAEDHLNDILSNAAALITASVAYTAIGAWWVDPVGAIIISIVIIYRWMSMIW